MSTHGFDIEVTSNPPAALDDEIRAWPAQDGLESVALPWSRLTVLANPGRVSLVTVNVRRGSMLVAVAIVHVVHRLAVGDYTGGPLERMTQWGRRIGYTPFAFDVAYLEVPFCNRSGLLLHPELDADERARILGAVIESLRGDALRVDALCIKGDTNDTASSRVLSSRGLARLPFSENNVLTLPASGPRFERWLDERSANRRALVRRDIRRFERYGGELMWAGDPAARAARIANLHARTAANAKKKGELPLPFSAHEAFYEHFRATLGDRAAVRLAMFRGGVIGFFVHLYGRETLFAKFIGLDYEHSLPSRAYFRLFYDAIEEACRREMKYIDLGSTTNHVKARLGCRQIATQYHVEFRRRLRPAGFVLSKMLASRFGQTAQPEPEM